MCACALKTEGKSNICKHDVLPLKYRKDIQTKTHADRKRDGDGDGDREIEYIKPHKLYDEQDKCGWQTEWFTKND